MVDEDGVVVEEEPEDLGEYSRPVPPVVSSHGAPPTLERCKDAHSNDLQGAIAAPFATGSSIVYAPTRAEVDTIAAMLKDAGLAAEAYHAGLRPLHLAKVHTGFLRGDVKVVVATVAFGMGINKVRFGMRFVCVV